MTSSNSSAAGIAAGSGVPTRHIDRWIGVVKAYTTRVGGGPFPTEQDNEIGERIRRVGREYGTVTGRPRRCGWFDAVAVRYSARVSGSTEIAVMLLDVLSGTRRAAGRRRLRGREGPQGGRDARPSRRPRAVPAGLRDAPRLARRPDRSPLLGRPARRGARTTSASSRSRSAFRSRSSRSAPSAGRRSSWATMRSRLKRPLGTTARRRDASPSSSSVKP